MHGGWQQDFERTFFGGGAFTDFWSFPGAKDVKINLGFCILYMYPVSYTHLTLPTIYSV